MSQASKQHCPRPPQPHLLQTSPEASMLTNVSGSPRQSLRVELRTCERFYLAINCTWVWYSSVIVNWKCNWCPEEPILLSLFLLPSLLERLLTKWLSSDWGSDQNEERGAGLEDCYMYIRGTPGHLRLNACFKSLHFHCEKSFIWELLDLIQVYFLLQ